MQFLRTIFWVLLAVLAVAFGMKNSGYVTLSFWEGYAVDVRLPLLLAVVFLLGLIPPWVLHRITRWTMGRKLEAANRQLLETRTILEPNTLPARVEAPPREPLPPGAVPIAPPPGVG